MSKSINIVDRGFITKPQITEEGYLVCDVDFARVGVQYYMNFELGIYALKDKKSFDLVGVLRPESEVFNKDSMESFSLLPLTDGHPSVFLDSETVKDYSVGTTGENVVRNGDFLNVRIKVTDKDIVDSIQSGKKQFSAGYNSVLIKESGNYRGHQYHFIQKLIRGNHLAVNINNARCGSGCSIKDSIDMKKSILLDHVNLDDAVKAAIQALESDYATLEQQLADSQANATQIQKSWDSCKAEKQSKIDSLTAERDQLRANKVTDEAINAMVKERIQVIQDCQKIMPDVNIELSSFDMMKSVVAAKCADIKDSIDTRSKDYIQARFDMLKSNPTLDAFNFDNPAHQQQSQKTDLVDSQAARAKSINGDK